jgi:DNA-directed RNA polymerase subunit beta
MKELEDKMYPKGCYIPIDTEFKRDLSYKHIFATFKAPWRYSLGEVGRHKLNKKFGLDLTDNQLTSLDVQAARNWLYRLRDGKEIIDDIDHFQNRRVRQSGELIQNQFENGVTRLRKLVRRKLRTPTFESLPFGRSPVEVSKPEGSGVSLLELPTAWVRLRRTVLAPSASNSASSGWPFRGLPKSSQEQELRSAGKAKLRFAKQNLENEPAASPICSVNVALARWAPLGPTQQTNQPADGAPMVGLLAERSSVGPKGLEQPDFALREVAAWSTGAVRSGEASLRSRPSSRFAPKTDGFIKLTRAVGLIKVSHTENNGVTRPRLRLPRQPKQPDSLEFALTDRAYLPKKPATCSPRELAVLNRRMSNKGPSAVEFSVMRPTATAPGSGRLVCASALGPFGANSANLEAIKKSSLFSRANLWKLRESLCFYTLDKPQQFPQWQLRINSKRTPFHSFIPRLLLTDRCGLLSKTWPRNLLGSPTGTKDRRSNRAELLPTKGRFWAAPASGFAQATPTDAEPPKKFSILCAIERSLNKIALGPFGANSRSKQAAGFAFIKPARLARPGGRAKLGWPEGPRTTKDRPATQGGTFALRPFGPTELCSAIEPSLAEPIRFRMVLRSNKKPKKIEARLRSLVAQQLAELRSVGPKGPDFVRAQKCAHLDRADSRSGWVSPGVAQVIERGITGIPPLGLSKTDGLTRASASSNYVPVGDFVTPKPTRFAKSISSAAFGGSRNLGSVNRTFKQASELFSTKPINGALREFFGSNPLSQYMDQTNPLAEVTHKRRISSLGIGGVSRESAGMAIRGIHPTHYGRICPIETPEGKNAGLVNSLALYARLNKHGFIETPYYKVIKGQVQEELGFSYYSALKETVDRLHLAPSDLQQSQANMLGVLDHTVNKPTAGRRPCSWLGSPKANPIAPSASTVRRGRTQTDRLPFAFGSRPKEPVLLGRPRRGQPQEAEQELHSARRDQNVFAEGASAIGRKAQPDIGAVHLATPFVQADSECLVPVRVADTLLDVFKKVSPYEVDCIGISPVQILSVATSLIPFLEHNDANRALMGSNMQRQAVPLMISERPIVGTGLETLIAAESGQVIQSSISGIVSHVSANKIIIERLFNTAAKIDSLGVPTQTRAKPAVGAVELLKDRAGGRLGTSLPDVALLSWVRGRASLGPSGPPSEARQRVLVYDNLLGPSRRNYVPVSCFAISKRNVVPARRGFAKAKLSFAETKSKKLHYLTTVRQNASLLRLKWTTPQIWLDSIISACPIQPSTGSVPRTAAIRTPTVPQSLTSTRTLTPLRRLNKIAPWLPKACSWVTVSLTRASASSKYVPVSREATSRPLGQPELRSGNPKKVSTSKNRAGGRLSRQSAGLGFVQAERGALALGVATQPKERAGGLLVAQGKIKNSDSRIHQTARYSAQLSKTGSGRLTDLTDRRSIRGFAKSETWFCISKPKKPKNRVLLSELSRLYKSSVRQSPHKLGPSGPPGIVFTRVSASTPEGRVSERSTPATGFASVKPSQSSFRFTETFQQMTLLPFVHSLRSFSRSNQETCLTQKPVVQEGEWVQKGEILTDCSASEKGELAVGKNVLIAYLPWEGYNFEDAIVVSDRLTKEQIYASLHIERYVCEAQDIKEKITNSNEWFTRNLPGVHPKLVSHLDTFGFPKIGTILKEGDILVGKMRYFRNKPTTPYEKLLSDILGDGHFSVSLTSLRVPKGVHEARVISHRVVKTFRTSLETTFTGVSRPAGTPKMVHIFLGEKRSIQIGDKMSGRHGNKGIISTILPKQDMPYLPDGSPIDILLNPLGVPSRMNVGQIFESLLGLASTYLNQNFKITAFDELYGVEASQSLVYLKLYQARLQSGQNWLFQINFPGKTRLIDGRSGECFDQWVTVGKAYMLKLIHMVNEKIHARNTGPYALITQQPLRGRSQKGGQRLGEMEVWALEGYGAAYILQELLTKKSDDFAGRQEIINSLVVRSDKFSSPDNPYRNYSNPDDPYHRFSDPDNPYQVIQETRLVLGHPEIFKTLICELQALCLDVGVYALKKESFQREYLGIVN